MIPELLWPDWSARLLASDGYSPDRLRALLSVALLIPGHPEGAFPTHAAQLNPDIRSRDVAELLQRLTSATTIHPDPVLTVLCRIAEHLDRQGSPIDYQRPELGFRAGESSWLQALELTRAVRMLH